jgi:predicted PurR-regulated permease PerM
MAKSSPSLGDAGASRAANTSATALVVLAVLGVIAALHVMKVILIPLVLALVLTVLLSPFTRGLRRILPLGALGAAVVLFLVLAVLGLYLASLTAESLMHAANTLPTDAERLAGTLSRRVADILRERPYLRGVLPDPGTIDSLGDRNRLLLMAGLRDRLADLTGWVAQGLMVLILVLFLLAESQMLMPKVIRFFAPEPGDAHAAERAFDALIREIRKYLVARTLINIVLAGVMGLCFKLLKVRYPWALGAVAGVGNFIPYVGQVVAGALAVLVALGDNGSLADGLIVAAVFLAVVGMEGYVVTPWVLGRSLDLNGTTVLVACLFWGYLWGLTGLILAMPITVSMKLIFQHVPALNRWAELMSLDWKTPPRAIEDTAPETGSIELVAATPVAEPAGLDPAALPPTMRS